MEKIKQLHGISYVKGTPLESAIALLFGFANSSETTFASPQRYIYIKERWEKGERREAVELMSVCNPRCEGFPFPPNAFYEVAGQRRKASDNI